jgi:hypothetical protein
MDIYLRRPKSPVWLIDRDNGGGMRATFATTPADRGSGAKFHFNAGGFFRAA